MVLGCFDFEAGVMAVYGCIFFLLPCRPGEG